MQNVECFAREMMLDPTECENCLYILPHLTRDSFSKKGLFYRTEKILIQNYSSCFQFPTAAKAYERISKVDEKLQILISEKESLNFFSNLLSTEFNIHASQSKGDFQKNIILYILT